MADKIRLGIIGANVHLGWARRSHLPAIVASPEFELTGVCTTRMESAEESKQKFGAKLAFDDYHKICLLYTSPSPRDQRGSRGAW